MPGPLEGIRIVEFAGIGPGPFAAMLLADMGADVVRIDRPTGATEVGVPREADPLNRGRRSIALNLKHDTGRTIALALIDQADALVEGFRPGVMERLGFGPVEMAERNPRLVYGRVTGWGQDGPLAATAGHDIDYIALTGALATIGPPGEPLPPLNLIGDFGGGGMLLAFGIVSALLEAGRSGRGQVVDAAMVDGASLLMTMIYGMRAAGVWEGGRGANLLDGGAPFYATYACADGRHMAVGAIEPQFYAELLRILEIPADSLADQFDESGWVKTRSELAATFATRTRAEWTARFDGSDACVAPVLELDEAPAHPHLVARETFVDLEGIVQPAPAPRFGRTVPRARPVRPPGADGREILRSLGYGEEETAAAVAGGAVLLPDDETSPSD